MPTVPSTSSLRADVDAGDAAAAEEHHRDAAGARRRAPARGWARRAAGRPACDRTRPATVTCWRQRTSPIGLAPGDDADRRRRASGSGSGAASPLAGAAVPPRGRTSVGQRHLGRVDLVEVERHGGDVGVGQAGHLLEDRVGRLVVEDPVPDALVLAVGEQHADLGLAVGQLAGHALHRGAGEAPVGAVDDLERDPLEAGARPTRRAARGPRSSSTAKCTARSSSGVSVRAYWMARAEAMSSRSTNTSTTWRRRIGAVAAAGTSCSSWCGLLRVLPVEPQQQRPRTAASTTTITQAPSVNLVIDHDDDDGRREEGADAVDHEALPPARLLVAQVVLGHAGLRQREARRTRRWRRAGSAW